MNTKDPKLIALQFNDRINNQDIDGLALLMTDDHAFIDRDGKVHEPKESMVRSWRQFFGMFPNYRNIFTRVESQDNLVVIVGHAYWSEAQPFDPVIWTAIVVDDMVREWRIYADTERNRQLLNLI